MLNLKQQITTHPYMISFFALLSTLLKFVVQSWQVDGILFIFLFVLIAINTYTGIKKAKKTGEFSLTVLKEKTTKKVLGYVIFLIALWVFVMMLFLMNIKDGTPFINPYYLNVPLMTALLFYAAIEVLSIKDNLVFLYSIKTPTAVTDKLENIVNAGGADFEKLIK